jgi:ribosomal protein L10
MNKEQKNVAIEEITTDIQESEAIFVVDYRGMTVPQAAELRAKLREADTSLRVVKNTLTKRAAAAAGTEDLNEFLVGPTAIAFVRGDAALAAKELAAAQKAFEILDFKGGRAMVVRTWEITPKTKAVLKAYENGAQPRVSVVERRVMPETIAFQLRVQSNLAKL